MKKSGILLLILTGCLIQALGQETLRFHSDPMQFIQEAREFFGNSPPEDTRVLLLNFEEAQKDGKLEENHWIDLARKANIMERFGARPYPDFHLLLDSFLELSTRSADRSTYLEWSRYLDSLMINSKKNLIPVKSFLSFSVDLARRGILYQSSAFKWKVRPGINSCGTDSAFYVMIGPTDLVVSGSGDSIAILSTRGRYYPDSRRFYGEDGQITWQRVNIPPAQVLVRLNRYTLDLSRSTYTIDSVNLIDKRYFTDPLLGEVENKILPGARPETAGYPRFTSYELRNRIKNLYPGMDYEGAFSLQGLKVLGTGLASQKNILTIFRKERPIMRMASAYFSFQPGQARGINTETSIYLGADSIYHPGLLFQYNVKQKEVSLIRDGEGLSPSRFLDTYHGYDLNVEWIRWITEDSLMTMTGLPGSIENRASFESSDFFNIDRYNEILMADKVHPVTAVKQCADYYYSRNYSLAELAKFMSKPQHLVEEMLLRLTFLGFVRYNSTTQLIEVQERAYDFLKKNAGQQDYDVIRFESVHEPPQANAILNLDNSHLKVFWVRSIEISQKRRVTLFPANETIEILKDRNILLDGEIQAGLVRFTGRQFRFNYDDFLINLNQVSKMRMRVYEKVRAKNAEPLTAEVTSLIENTKGILRIDEPGNKSGVRVEDYPEYPILQTDTTAYVYYDQKAILNGVYPRESFYFNISPFTLQGLNLYTFSDSLIFPGKFITAGIFPPLTLALKHQSDHSLGFETQKTPEEGYPVYQGKGRFFNSIAMSKAGLKGSGRLEYLNSELESEDFLFLPDQVVTTANLLVSRDTTDAGNPEIQGQELAVKWYPGGDKLVARGTKDPIDMYGKGLFDGEVSLEPQGLNGNGTIRFKGYSITSNEFKFYQDSYESLNGVLRIFSDSTGAKPETLAEADEKSYLVAHQFNGLVEVNDQKAVFEPAGESSRIVFTRNRFEGRPKMISWDMARGRLAMDEIKFRMATRPSDSLNFMSGQADFALNDLAIRAHSVDFVDVADVRVFPADRNVVIRESAKIDSLTQATIVSRDTSLVHRINNATVTLIDQKRYRAKGNYQYQDIAGRDFAIHFSDIQPDKQGISLGTGTIAVENNFSLNPAFKYYGSVEWNNNERLLLFDGQTQLSHLCPNVTSQWIRFSNRISPDSVAIPIDSITTNDQKERLFKGFFLSNQPIELYSTFIGPHLRYSDKPLITAHGLLWYDESLNQYRLASAEKKADPGADGPMLILDPGACVTEGIGPLTLGVDLGQVKLSGAGRLIDDHQKDSITLSAILTLDFFMDPKILEYMAKSINDAAGLEAVNYADPAFRESFMDLLGHAKGDELLKQISLTGKWRKTPEELMHSLVLSNVQFKWNPETGSYQSVGKIGVSNILETSINKKMNGHMEVVHRRSGDTFAIYLEIDRQNYFFMTYTRGLLQCVAGPSYEKFNTMLRGTKEGKRKLKVEPGETEYQYYIGTYGLVSEFLRRFRTQR